MPAVRRLSACLSLVVFAFLTTVRGDVLSQWFPRSFSAPAGNNYSLSDILFANGLFVAVGEDGDFGAIVTSRDGVNWTFHNVTDLGASTTLSVNAIGYGNGRFVGVGWMGVRSLSLDGTNWTQGWIRTPGGVNPEPEYYGVAYGGGQFVAVGYAFSSPPTNTAFSSDGVNWTLRRGPMAALRRVAYGNGVFLAIGPQGLARSTGLSFSTVNTTSFADITFGNGVFVLVSTNGIFTRDSSALLTDQSVTNLPVSRVTFGNGMFFAVNTNGTVIFTSTNGTNWIARDVSPPLSYFFSVFTLASGAGTLVGVGYPNRISQSAPFASVAGANNGALRVSGIVGATYRVETRGEFHPSTPWVPAGSLILTNSPQTWTDPESTNSARRFYRTQLLP